MKLPSFTTQFDAPGNCQAARKLMTGPIQVTSVLLLLPLLLCLTFPLAAQRIAVLAPDHTETRSEFALRLEQSLGQKVTILDDSLSETAFRAVGPPNHYNITTDESKRIGAAIGCDYFVLIGSAVIRRSSFERSEYYEAHAAIFGVSSRTGRLVFWKLPRFEESTPAKAAASLNASVDSLSAELVATFKTVTKNELDEVSPPVMEEVPEANSVAAKGFRSPVPYRRVKPEYTSEAALYDIEATVDILVDLDADGSVLRTEIVRWAAYELDRSVDQTVRQMNWRPAERNAQPMAMRFLLRYNFKKVDKH